MPQLVPLTLATSTADSDLTFDPITLVNGLATLAAESNVTSASLAPVLTVSTQRPSKTSKVSKSRIKLVRPVPVMSGGVATDTKKHDGSFDVTFLFNADATIEEKTIMLELFRSAATDLTIEDIVLNNRPYY